MTTVLLRTAIVLCWINLLTPLASMPTAADAQPCCCNPSCCCASGGCCEPASGCSPSYRPVCQTVYETQPVTTYRIRNEIVYEQRVVTAYQAVWETQTRKCEYTIARPETHCVEREERYAVLRPVWETRIQDESYDVVRNVVESHEREERYTISRPVCETTQQAQTYKVRRYVTRTVDRDVPRVSYAPVTSMQTTHVDQGRYVTQQVQRQGWSFNALRWAPGTVSTDPNTGRQKYQLPGLAWVKNPPPVRTVSRQVWQSNVVAVQVPRTSYQRVVTNVKVPTQVGDWVEESVVRNVPVRVCKTVTEEHVRKVPYTTTRQVVERVERKVPVRVCKYVREERVRKVPCTYTRMMYEQCSKEIPVQVCRMIPVQKTILVPRCIQKVVPVVQQCSVPRTVIVQVPYSINCGQWVADNGNVSPPVLQNVTPKTFSDDASGVTPAEIRSGETTGDGWRPRMS